MNPFSKDNALSAITLGQLGQETEITPLDTETFDEVKRRTLSSQKDLETTYMFSGSYLSGLAALESELLSLILHLSREKSQPIVEAKASRMPAAKRRDLLASPLPSDWAEGDRLIQNLAQLANWRNQLAHSPLVAFTVDDGQILPGPFIVAEELDEGEFVTSYVPLTEIDQAIRSALLVVMQRMVYMLWLLIPADYLADANADLLKQIRLARMLRSSGVQPELTELELQVLDTVFPA